MLKSDYQRMANRTECDQQRSFNRIRIHHQGTGGYDYEMSTRLLHCVVGLSGEMAEIQKSDSARNLKEELGDVLWYTAQGANAMGIVLDNNSETRTFSLDYFKNMLLCEVGNLASLVEKWLFYGQSLDFRCVRNNLNDIVGCIHNICLYYGWTVDELMEMNISKLRQRYPEKFTEELALEVNRNREAESQVMEQNGHGWVEPKETEEG